MSRKEVNQGDARFKESGTRNRVSWEKLGFQDHQLWG